MSFVRDERFGGARRDRTADLLRARQALSQLSYGPFNLSFFRQPALHLPRAWSHTRVYAPGARVKCALSGEKNPALKTPRRICCQVFPRISPVHALLSAKFLREIYLRGIIAIISRCSFSYVVFQAAQLPHENDIFRRSFEGDGVACAST